MASLNPDKGVLSHGEELEWNAMNTALNETPSLGGRTAKKTLPQVTFPWQGYDTCRNCGLYGRCFTLEANHGET